MGIYIESNLSKISGQTVYLASGFNNVNAIVNVNISGQTVVSNVSGQTVALWQGSGQNGVYLTNQGQSLFAALNAINLDTYSVSNTALHTLSAIVGFDSSSTQFKRVRVTESGSPAAGGGTDFRLKTSLWSGDFQAMSGMPIQISGQTVVIGGTVPVTTSISGNKVDVSGSAVVISGQRVNTSGSAAIISGQPVGTSGQKTRLQAFDPSGNTWNDLIVNQSGGNALRVDAGSINVASNVSGNKIRLQGFDPSGNTWNDLIINQSGGNVLRVDPGTVTIAGAVTTSVSGNTVNIGTAPTLTVQGTVTTATPMSGGSMSGQLVNFNISGGSLSGQSVITQMSGGSMSGQVVNVSGASAIISGQPIRQSPWLNTRVPVTKQITALSGGFALDSGIAQMVTVRNIGQSGTIMFVGYSGINNAPFVSSERSGRGFQLKDGDSITLPVTTVGGGNMELIRVVSLTSGQEISYIGIDY